MLLYIYVNGDNITLITNNTSYIFKIDEEKFLEKIKNEINKVNDIVIKLNLNDDIQDFNNLYNKIKKYMNNDKNLIIDISEATDTNIIKKYKQLQELEKNTKCHFQYKYDIYATSSIKDIFNAIQFVEEKAQIVKQSNLSPVESLMFIYDMIRDREYTKEKEEEGVDVSRNITRVLTSSSIVCAGFANLFSAIANKVGIYTENIIWKNMDTYKDVHVSNISYINDDKYDIHGIIEIDVTKGSRKSKENNSFLNNYSSFGNYLIKSERFNNNNGLIYSMDINNLFYKICQDYRNLKHNLKKEPAIMTKAKILNLIIDLKKYTKLIGIDLKEYEEIKKKLEKNEDINEIYNEIENILFNNKINDTIYACNIDYYDFAEMLYTVRKIESLIDENKYPCSIEILNNIITKKYKLQNEESKECLSQLMYLFLLDNEFDNQKRKGR